MEWYWILAIVVGSLGVVGYGLLWIISWALAQGDKSNEMDEWGW